MNRLPYLDDFILNLKANNFSEETAYNYERDLTTFEYFLNEDINKSFDKIDKTDLLRYKAYLNSSDRKTAASAGKTDKKLGSY